MDRAEKVAQEIQSHFGLEMVDIGQVREALDSLQKEGGDRLIETEDGDITLFSLPGQSGVCITRHVRFVEF